jgi:hypothetical protein
MRLLILFCGVIVLGGPAVRSDELPANRWVKIAEDDLGDRQCRGPALLYVPPLKRFLVALGVQTRFDREPTPPYSELTLSLDDRAWLNWFPKGKDWGPRTGPADRAPSLGQYGSGLVEKDGILRPHLRGGTGICVWQQYCWDSDRNKAIFYAWCGSRHEEPMQLLEYDPLERTWRKLSPKNNPLRPNLPAVELEGYSPHWHWGSLCYDPVNKEVLLFGGASVITERGDPGTWVYSIAENRWTQVAQGNERINRLRERAEGLRRRAHRVVTSCRNRYYHTELAESAARKLAELIEGILAAREVEKLAAEVTGAKEKVEGHESRQLERAAMELAAAGDGCRALLNAVDAGVDVEAIRAAEGLEDRLRRAAACLSSQPPPRCCSRMAYDPTSRRIILFGGTQLDRCLADTWIYDPATRTWEQRWPHLSPTPRHMHTMLHLPQSGRLVLVGGWQSRFEVHTPLVPEAWAYDVAADEWRLLRRWESKLTERGGPFEAVHYHGPANNVVNFAVSEDDVVLMQRRATTWACRLELDRAAPAEAEAGVPPGTERLLAATEEERSTGWYDAAPVPDPEAVAARLKELPLNKWIKALDGGRLRPTYAYSTIAMDADRDEILIWAGGHSTSHGTEVTRYSLSTGRWHIDYPPQLSMSYNRTIWGHNYAYGFRPWMPRHPWMAYAYDPVACRLVLARTTGPLTLTFDPDEGDFDRPRIALPPGGGAQANRMCSTPDGVVLWTTGGRLFRLNWQTHSWIELLTKGTSLPQAGFNDGMAYDTRRNRILLLLSRPKGKVLCCDPAAGSLVDVQAGGTENAPAYFREFEYVPNADIVFDMMGAAYDVATNAWARLIIDTTELLEGFHRKHGMPTAAQNAQGLVYDPKRGLLWAVNGYGRSRGVFVMKLKKQSASKGAAAQPAGGGG